MRCRAACSVAGRARRASQVEVAVAQGRPAGPGPGRALAAVQEVVEEEHQVIQRLVIQVQQDQEVLVVVLQQLILIQVQVPQEQ